MLQAKAAGIVDDIAAMRRLIADSIETANFVPEDAEDWDKGYEQYLRVYREDL
jgi:rhamnulokinase